MEKKTLSVDKIFVAKNSSNIDRVGVVGSDLVVQFMNGSIYQYKNGAEKFDLLTKAESVGKALNQVKSGMEYVKLDVESLVTNYKETEKKDENTQKTSS